MYSGCLLILLVTAIPTSSFNFLVRSPGCSFIQFNSLMIVCIHSEVYYALILVFLTKNSNYAIYEHLKGQKPTII